LPDGANGAPADLAEGVDRNGHGGLLFRKRATRPQT
jgi:hypothetical protein